MLGLILTFITGLAGPFFNFAGQLTDLKKAKIAADSDKERARINEAIEEVHDKKAVLVALAANKIYSVFLAILQLGFAIPAIMIMVKLAYDKVIGPFYGCVGKISESTKLFQACKQFNTDSMDPNIWWVILSIVGFLFVTTMVAKRN